MQKDVSRLSEVLHLIDRGPVYKTDVTVYEVQFCIGKGLAEKTLYEMTEPYFIEPNTRMDFARAPKAYQAAGLTSKGKDVLRRVDQLIQDLW